MVKKNIRAKHTLAVSIYAMKGRVRSNTDGSMAVYQGETRIYIESLRVFCRSRSKVAKGLLARLLKRAGSNRS